MIKNLYLVVSIFLMTGLTIELSAQNNPGLFLSNHTFSSENNLIGKISLTGSASKFKLIGENVKRFELKENQLYILKKYIGSATKWYDLTIEVQTASGKIEQNFRLVNDNFHKNRVIAHRGAWKNTGAAENSIAALQHAVKLGCQGTEFDVHMTMDSVYRPEKSLQFLI